MDYYNGMTILLESESYVIGLANDMQYDPHSADNVTAYNNFYVADIDNDYRYSSRHGIYVYSGPQVKNLVCVCSSGGATSVHPTCAVLDNENIVLCCGRSIFNLTVPELDLCWIIKADSATCFEIFKHSGGYIIHGELKITKVNRDGLIVWQFSGSDIFTTPTGKNDFILEGDIIQAINWDGQKFNIDANTGKEVKKPHYE